MDKDFKGLCFVNLVDFDALWGHRRNPVGYAQELEKFDVNLGKVIDKLGQNDLLIITADHGNAEKMIDYETGEPHTAHTTNPVPFILVNADPKYTLREGGCLADIAPTLLQIMGLEQPKEMTGKSLLIEK